MKIFQLIASGPGISMDSKMRIHSKVVFRTKEEAVDYMREFHEKCTTLTNDALDSIKGDSCEMRVVELELREPDPQEVRRREEGRGRPGVPPPPEV